MAEINPFARAVLSHRYPTTPAHCDFTTIEPEQYGAVDLIVGGTPCQDFSAIGLRAGLTGERGNLAIAFFDLVSQYRARGFIWENVPGVLAADGGRAFGTILGALEERGYEWAYRIVDAQYHGVPQRRRRLVLVGSDGYFSPAEVLFDTKGLCWDSAAIEGAQVESDTVAFSYKDSGADAGPIAPTLRALNHHHGRANGGSHIAFADGEYAWKASVNECERLQGLPDDYTLVPFNGKPAADYHRYHAIGNVGMPPALWAALGARIEFARDVEIAA